MGFLSDRFVGQRSTVDLGAETGGPDPGAELPGIGDIRVV
jgi:hypothetical protein